jgi:hypothetical protein
MASLVLPNGLFGRPYMAAIKPFRYLIIYPALTRQWERAWLDHGREGIPGGPTRRRKIKRMQQAIDEPPR